MLGCLPLEFSYPWSIVSKLRLCVRFPRAQSNKIDQTLHQVGIPYLLAEHGNWCLSVSAVVYGWVAGVAAPIPRLCPIQAHAGQVLLEAMVALHHT